MSMSRIAKNPVTLPKGVEVSVNDGTIIAKGPKGELSMPLYKGIAVAEDEGKLVITLPDFPENDSSEDSPNGENKKKVAQPPKSLKAMSGTTRALLNNLVQGVSTGFEKKLTIIGVGYRAAAKGSTLSLNLGFSHPVDYALPDGITAETPTATEIVIRGNDKQVVGQVAAEIRRYRPPEPYKGKGIRYADEYVMRKQAKKK